MRIELKPRAATGASKGVIFWNPETGSIRCDNPVIEGDLAYLINRAVSLGCVHLIPHPHILPVQDPTHSYREFAAICGTLWEIPDPLKPYYPQPTEH